MTRARIQWIVPLVATIAWVIVMAAGDHWSRIAGHWASTVTMLFGSFLAGSSPEGGGAVAFPIFTKVLHVPAATARTFGLTIQAVGMSAATIAILASGRTFHRRAAAIGAAAGALGLLIGLAWLGRPDELFWPAAFGAGWVKATFSIVLATTSVFMIRHLRGADPQEPLAWNRRLDGAIATVALAGGVLASLTGTGTNIALFLFLVAVVGIGPKVAVPTAVITMAAVSVVGALVLGLADGQLDVTVVGDTVTAVGGEATDLPASEVDLFGLWMAAVPVVVWGAPLGSWFASVIRERALVAFVAVLAALEVITTFVLVDEIRTDPAILTYLVTGLVLAPVGLAWTRRHRHRLFG